jgi:hypothetical protein
MIAVRLGAHFGGVGFCGPDRRHAMSELARTVTRREQADQGSLTLAPIWSNRSSPALHFLLGKSFIASLVEPDRRKAAFLVKEGQKGLVAA